MISTYRS